MINLLIMVCLGVLIVSLYDMITIKKELKYLNKKYDEISNDILKIDNMMKNHSKSIIVNKPIVVNNSNTFINKTIINNNFNNSEKITFLDMLLEISSQYGEDYENKFIVSKNDVASLMRRYNETEKHIFSQEYILIYNKAFLTALGIKYLEKYGLITNDIVNNSLIIKINTNLNKGE